MNAYIPGTWWALICPYSILNEFDKWFAWHVKALQGDGASELLSELLMMQIQKPV